MAVVVRALFRSRWVPHVPGNVTGYEVAAELERRRALTHVERLDEGLRVTAAHHQGICDVLARENPDAPHYELIALWNERMYRGKVPDAVLDNAMAEIRRLGALGLPPFDT